MGNWLKLYAGFLVAYTVCVIAFYTIVPQTDIHSDFTHWKVHQAVLDDIRRDKPEGERNNKELWTVDFIEKCPKECSRNGLCDLKGNCHCNQGFSGASCELKDEKATLSARFPMLGREFYETFGCQLNDYYEFINKELSFWNKGNITSLMADESVRLHPSCVIIQVIDNKAYIAGPEGKKAEKRKYAQSWVGWRAMFMDLLKWINIPNVEFTLCLAERPIVIKHDAWIVFGFSGSDLHQDIVIPSSYHKLLDSDASTPINWDEKLDKVYWRGNPTGLTPVKVFPDKKTKPMNPAVSFDIKPRYKLVKYGEISDFVDAGFIGNYNHPSYPELTNVIGAMKKPHTNHDEKKFKYLVAVDGDSSSEELSSLMQYGSAVFLVKPVYQEYIHDFLKPNEHYIPVPSIDELLPTIQSELKNQGKLKKVAEQGRIMMRNLMRPQELYCYYWRLFHSYKLLLNYEPTRRPKSVPIEKVSQNWDSLN